MLESMGDQNYYTFRTHYWDWRREIQMANDDIFVRNRVGESRNISNQPQVRGDLFDGGWDTICWYDGSGNVSMPKGTTCDPRIKTGLSCQKWTRSSFAVEIQAGPFLAGEKSGPGPVSLSKSRQVHFWQGKKVDPVQFPAEI